MLLIAHSLGQYVKIYLEGRIEWSFSCIHTPRPITKMDLLLNWKNTFLGGKKIYVYFLFIWMKLKLHQLGILAYRESRSALFQLLTKCKGMQQNDHGLLGIIKIKQGFKKIPLVLCNIRHAFWLPLSWVSHGRETNRFGKTNLFLLFKNVMASKFIPVWFCNLRWHSSKCFH